MFSLVYYLYAFLHMKRELHDIAGNPKLWTKDQ
jgi:hypothetical protein